MEAVQGAVFSADCRLRLRGGPQGAAREPGRRKGAQPQLPVPPEGRGPEPPKFCLAQL